MYNRVAIIDDDPINNLICEKVIQRLAFAQEVLSFSSAVDALNWLKEEPQTQWPELIFLDINLPYMDGWEFLSHLPQTAGHPFQIYILSSSVSEDDQSKASEHERVNGFLIKPLTLEKLKQLTTSQ